MSGEQRQVGHIPGQTTAFSPGWVLLASRALTPGEVAQLIAGPPRAVRWASCRVWAAGPAGQALGAVQQLAGLLGRKLTEGQDPD